MTINKNTRFLIIGLGLLGGSYARGLTEKGYYVEAITKNQKDCYYALDHEIVKKCITEVDAEMIKSADVIIFALYPDINENMWSELFLMNKKALLSEMELFRKHFDDLYTYLKNDDREGMKEMMRISTERRKQFDK